MKGPRMKYFVLNPYKDNAYGMASRSAITDYAYSIEDHDPQLSKELIEWMHEVFHNPTDREGE